MNNVTQAEIEPARDVAEPGEWFRLIVREPNGAQWRTGYFRDTPDNRARALRLYGNRPCA